MEGFDLSQIRETYKPTAGAFEVRLPLGEVLTFRAPQRKRELDALLSDALQWYSTLPKPGSPEEGGHPFAGVLPQNAAEAADAYVISHLSVEPAIDERTALSWLDCPWLITAIVEGIEHGCKTMRSMMLADAVAEAKKNSKGTTSGASS